MMICPQCGYERKQSDSIISEAECPKCGIIYSKWQQKPAASPLRETPAASQKNPPPSDGRKQISLGKAVIFATLVILVIIVAFNAGKMFRSEKNPSSKDPSAEAIVEEKSKMSEDQQTAQNLSVQPVEHLAVQKELSISDIIRANRQSIVLVKTQAGIGSGFFINHQGYVVTNKHVVAQAERAEIKTIRGSVFRVNQIILEDADADLVIVSTDATSQESKPVQLNIQLPEVGEKVVVIGNPLGLEQTVSDGIVSAVRRNQNSVEFIQVTAPVSPGNSGGPLFNMRGEVIGVATFQYRGGQNLNFCVAASRIAGMQQSGRSTPAYSTAAEIQTPGGRDVYCFADSSGKVSFVDWKTGMLLTKPDGSLDRAKYQSWVIEQIGGNPDDINPDKEAQDDLERNRERLFKSVFPHRSINDTNLTSAENDWLERRYSRHYTEVYNRAVRRRNDAIRKYRSMMGDFERFAASRRP